jgi:hypothetical protein
MPRSDFGYLYLFRAQFVKVQFFFFCKRRAKEGLRKSTDFDSVSWRLGSRLIPSYEIYYSGFCNDLYWSGSRYRI